MPRIKILDLCSGSKSVCVAAYELWGEHNVEYWGLDADWKCQPELHLSILNWEYEKSFSQDYGWDIIWASPPCTEYSRAKSRGVRNLELADSIAKKCLEIIDFYKPRYWFVENPWTGMLKDRDFMQPNSHLMHRCTYCHYGRPFMKPTSIWTNREGLKLKDCFSEKCEFKQENGRHYACAQSGPRRIYDATAGRHETGMIPKDLVFELFEGIQHRPEPVPLNPEPRVHGGEPA
jgi:hypothetical protein